MPDELSGAGQSSIPPSFDFDDDAIVSLLDTFVATQTGPQGKRVSSRPPDPDDVGARTAQRTVFQDASRHETLPLVGETGETKRRRIELLDALAERSAGSTRARLLTSAAELCEQLGEVEQAVERYERAHESDARDVVVLRALRRHAMRRADWKAATEALEREAALDLGPEERGAALWLLAQIQLYELGDAAAAEQTATRATKVESQSFVASMLLAGARFARKDRVQAARALVDAAERWPSEPAQAVVLAHAASLMEAAGAPNEAKSLFERVLGLDPSSIEAHLGVVRAARALGDTETVVAHLLQAANETEGDLARAFRRAAAVASRAAGRRDEATAWLGAARDAASLWTAAETAMSDGELHKAAEVLGASPLNATDEIGLVAAARRARLWAELGELQSARETVHPDLDEYLRSLGGLRSTDDAARHGLDRMLDSMPEGISTRVGRFIEADEAAHRGDWARFSEALLDELREAADTDEGAVLAWSETLSPVEALEALLAAEDRFENGVLLRHALTIVDEDTDRCALRWRDYAATSEGERSAFALTMAARLTRSPEAAQHACETALERARGFFPALWFLEEAAEDRKTRARAAALQAEEDASSHARHRLRASMWAESTPERHRHAEAALDPKALDPLLVEHLFECAGHGTDSAAELMALAARRLGSAGYLVRAADAHRAAGLATRAASALREAATQAPDNLALRVRLRDAELEAGEFARLADTDMHRAREALEDADRLRAFCAMAEVDRLARRDMQSARLSLQSIAEVRPDHIPTARALEWDALREGDADRIRSSVKRLLRALPKESPDRVARQRLTIELLRADPDILQNDIDRALRRIDDDLESDPGLARQVLGAAYAKDETELGLRALIALQASVSDDLERAAFGLEAAHLLQRAGDTGGALEALNTAGGHPLALEAEAALLRSAKRWEDSAAAYEEAAARAKDPRRVASLFREAACVRADELGDDEGALRAWQRAAYADITYLDVYRRLAATYEERGMLDELADLTDARIDVGADTPTLVGLLLEKAAQCRARDDVDGVIDALSECLELDPNHHTVLRELVDTHRGREDWQGAAEALIRIARLKRSPDEQVWAFGELGEIYHEHLADLQRAEASLRRALEIAPTHLEILDRLASVLTEQDRPHDAARALRELVRRSAGQAAQRDYRIRLAATIELAGEGRQAEALLEELRAERPTDSDVLLAVADYYERQGARPAESMHLNRAVNDLRAAIDSNPGDEALWTTLVRVLHRRHGPGAASCAASAAIAIGHPASLFEGDVSEQGEALGEPKLPLRSVVDDIVAPPGLPQTARRLFSLCEHSFDKMLPFDAAAWRLKRPSSEHRALVDEARDVAEALGVSEPKLRMTYVAPSSCMPITGDPPTLVVGGNLHEMTNPKERFFLFARALKVTSSHMAPALRARPEELDVALLALLYGHDPSRPHGPEPEQLHDLRKKLMKAVPRRWRDEVESLVLELAGNSAFSTRLVPFAVSSLGDRVALTLTGDVPSAADALLKMAGHDVPQSHADRLQAIRETPEAWALIRFAISDAHFEARAQAGVDR